jgi:CRISPR-associated protein Csx17
MRHDMKPIRLLDSAWTKDADDKSPEYALAASFASWRIRGDMVPVDQYGNWDKHARVVWPPGNPLANLVEVARRRIVKGDTNSLADLRGRAHPGVVLATACMLKETFNLERFDAFLHGLSLVKSETSEQPGIQTWTEHFDATFWVLRAVVSPTAIEHTATKDVSAILAALRAGALDRAVGIALRRLRALQWSPIAPARVVAPRTAATYEAALLVPFPKTYEHHQIRRYLRAPEVSSAQRPSLSITPTQEY